MTYRAGQEKGIAPSARDAAWPLGGAYALAAALSASLAASPSKSEAYQRFDNLQTSKGSSNQNKNLPTLFGK